MLGVGDEVVVYPKYGEDIEHGKKARYRNYSYIRSC